MLNEANTQTVLGKYTNFQVDAIQFLPEHTCPTCGASAILYRGGMWFILFYPTGPGFCELDNWRDHLAYVKFECGKECHPNTSLRVAKLGDAIVPFQFATQKEAKSIGMPVDALNAEILRRAVGFLTANIDPERLEENWLAHTIYSVFSGGVGPAVALRLIRDWALAQQSEPWNVSKSEFMTEEI